MNKYTIKDFRRDFPTEESCINYLLDKKLNNGKCPVCSSDKIYPIKGRKSFECSNKHKISPTADTIFHKSSTSLDLWFYAIFLFSVSKNGVSAKEIERQLGVTYKTAWRIANRIRKLMENKLDKIDNSVIEIDETYIGGKEQFKHKNKKTPNTQGRSTLTKTPIIGIIDRKTNKVTAKVVNNVRESEVNMFIGNKVSKNTLIISDEYKGYKKLNQRGWEHKTINHGKKEYANGDIHTNTIEGFWSVWKED